MNVGKRFVVKDGLIPRVTANNLGPNFPKDEIKIIEIMIRESGLTNGTGRGALPTSTTTTTTPPPS